MILNECNRVGRQKSGKKATELLMTYAKVTSSPSLNGKERGGEIFFCL